MSKAKTEQNFLQNAAQFLKTKYDEFFKFTYKSSKTYDKDVSYQANFRYRNHLQGSAYITSNEIIDRLRDGDKTGNYENVLLFLQSLNSTNIKVKFGEKELSNVLLDSEAGESDKTIIACLADRYYAFKKNNPNSPATAQLEDMLAQAKTHIKPSHYPIFNSYVSEYSLMARYPDITPIDFNKLSGKIAPKKVAPDLSGKTQLPKNNHNITPAKAYIATISLETLPVEMPVAAMHKVKKSAISFAKAANKAPLLTHNKEDKILFPANDAAAILKKPKNLQSGNKENCKPHHMPTTLYEASVQRVKAYNTVKNKAPVNLTGIRYENLKKFSDLIGAEKKDKRLNCALKFR